MMRSFKIVAVKHPGVLKAALLLVTLVLYSLSTAAAPAPKKRFIVSHLTVKDPATGLVWTRNGNPAAQMLSWHDALRYVDMLNRRNYGGHSDWRLPDIDDLKKLVAAAREIRAESPDKESTIAAALTSSGFAVQAGDYWSATTSLFNNVEALYVSMISGDESSGRKSLYMHVWPVRSEPSKRRGAGAAPRAPSPGQPGDKAVRM